jgi:hypothetical protein
VQNQRRARREYRLADVFEAVASAAHNPAEARGKNYCVLDIGAALVASRTARHQGEIESVMAEIAPVGYDVVSEHVEVREFDVVDLILEHWINSPTVSALLKQKQAFAIKGVHEHLRSELPSSILHASILES